MTKNRYYIIMTIAASILAGCTLDEIHLQPQCVTQADFSHTNINNYSRDAIDNAESRCPEDAKDYPYCYLDLTQRKVEIYMCSICPQGEFFCSGECLPTKCPDPEVKPKCIYFDDLTSHETSDYPNPQLIQSHCTTTKLEYQYCYSNANNSDHLCTRCDKDSETPRYCADTKSCVDMACDNCSERHVSFTVGDEQFEFCAQPIATAEDFIKAAESSNTSQKYVLVNDIDLSDLDAYSNGSVDDYHGFQNFRGMFVSPEQHTISIKGGEGELSCGNAETCGLFTTLRGATIHNIRLNFNVSHPGSVGILAGTASDSKLSSIKVSGKVIGQTTRVGGIAGALLAGTTLTDATFSGQIEAPDAKLVGGITGEASQAELTAIRLNGTSVNGATHVGGIAGQLDAQSILSDATLSEDTQILGQNYIGGIAGASQAELRALSSNGTVTVTRPENTQEAHYIGGIVGQQDGSTLKDLSNSATLTIAETAYGSSEETATYIGGIAGAVLGNAQLSDLQNNGNILYNGELDTDVFDPFQCITQIGGIAGSLGGEDLQPLLKNAINAGSIQAPKAQCVGGILGKATNATIQNAQNKGDVLSTGNRIGGIAGQLLFNKLSPNIPSLAYDNLNNDGQVAGHSHVGGIFGFIMSARYLPIPISFNYLRNTANILDADIATSDLNPHGGIVGQFSAKVRDLTMSDLQNTGALHTPQSHASGGLIGHWVLYSQNTDVVPDRLRYTIKNSHSSADINANERFGGLIGQLTLDWGDQLSLMCHLTCHNTQTEMILSDVFAEGALTGNGAIGGLIGLIAGTSGNTPCELKFTDPNCSEYSKDSETFTQNSMLHIQNAYAAVDLNANQAATGMIGYLANHNAETEFNFISIDNFYFRQYRSNFAKLSGLFCLAESAETAVPRVKNIYAEHNLHNLLASSDHIASKINITTFSHKVSAVSTRMFVDDRPFVDILNENRGDHAEWIEKVLPDTNIHIPTLFQPLPDAP